MSLVCYEGCFFWGGGRCRMEKRVQSLLVFHTTWRSPTVGSESTIPVFILIRMRWFSCSCVTFGFGVFFLRMQPYFIKVRVCFCWFGSLSHHMLGLPHTFTSLRPSAALNSAFTCAVRLRSSCSSTRPYKWRVLVPEYKPRSRIDLLAVCW